MITALGTYVPERRLTPEVEALMETVTGERATSPERVLEHARAVAPLLADMVEPLLSMTLSPTMASASQKRNVVPAVCEITVDSRLLPGMTPAEQQQVVRQILGDGDYELEVLEAHGGTRSAIETPLWDAVSSWVESADPGAQAAPICVAGFTDSHWFREAFDTVAYGFFPSRTMPIETAARLIHSADERVPVDDLELGVSFLRHAAQSIL
jgi:acetylornithine deacetylase/succinyl-diaminopimelate desuccinylase-like protein